LILHFLLGVCKKLEAAAKLRDCGIIADWIPSIKNHIHWSAASSVQENKDEIEAKYRSIVNHVVNRHEHESAAFPVCLHGQLSDEEERNKLWFDAGTCYKSPSLESNSAPQYCFI
jgi:solute carrier family 8 (sodium/calcium exchanger)